MTHAVDAVPEDGDGLALTIDSCCEFRQVFAIHDNPLDIDIVFPLQREQYGSDLVRHTLEYERRDVRFVRISHAELSARWLISVSL
jgi:hypothetical protein